MKTILLGTEKESRMIFSSLVFLKGASEEFVVKRTLAFLKELGVESVGWCSDRTRYMP